jgi:hypothetical protein
MSEGGTQFDAGIEASLADLPARPDFWSYSSLKEMETCPRRYLLSRASYPDLWEGRGYPKVPAVAALFGDVVHGALDAIVIALVDAGCESPRAAGAAAVLRELGGYTAVTERVLDERMERLDTNPRLDEDGRQRLNRDLRGRVAEARAQVQAYVSRVKLPPEGSGKASAGMASGDPGGGPAFGRRPVGSGAHAEMPLAAEELRLMGRVDLLAITEDRVDITDYKTGIEDPSHLDQLNLYALLWDLDRVVNPDRRPIAELTASYPSREVTISAPGESALRNLESSLKLRIASADAEIDTPVPRAVPSEEHCRFCQVRQLCDDYWSGMVPDPATLADGEWFDYQGVVGPQNGAHSWWMLREGSGQKQLLLRTTATAPQLSMGSRIRALGLRLDEDPEVNATVAVMTVWSEVFFLTASGG